LNSPVFGLSVVVLEWFDARYQAYSSPEDLVRSRVVANVVCVSCAVDKVGQSGLACLRECAECGDHELAFAAVDDLAEPDHELRVDLLDRADRVQRDGEVR